MIMVTLTSPGVLCFTIDHMSQGWEGGSTTAWRTVRAYVLARDGHLCRIGTEGVCTAIATCADHIIPKDMGGGDEETNLRAACEPCNLDRARKQAKLYEEPAPRRVSSW